MEILTFGGGKRQKECEKILRLCCSSEERIILLPIPTTRDNKYITGTDCSIDEIASLVDGKTILAGYAIPEALSNSGARVYDASLDEEFLLQNAILTAKGALGYLLTHYDSDVSELNIGVVGYGRIGKEFLRLILLMGSSPTLYTTREGVAMELGRLGVRAEIPSKNTDLSDLDILVNTAPARIFGDEQFPSSLDIIDLASGNNFNPGKRLIKLRSIPDEMYPSTAGRIYARHIIDFISGEKNL